MLIDDLKNGESDQLEFKLVPNRDSAKWLKTVVAFANGRGGRIVFGVSNDRRVVGLEGDLFAMKDGIADAIADACSPSVPFELCVSTVEGRPVIVLDVAEGRQPPYFIKAKGEVEGVFVRYDATTRQADEMSLRELRVEGSGKGYDEVRCRGLQVNDDEVAALCKRMYHVACENAAGEDERKRIKPVQVAQLVKWGVLKSAGKGYVATHAYALLVGSELFSPVVKCALFRGATRSVFVDRRQFVGPADIQIEEAYNWTLSKINLGAEFGHGVRRKDVYEIPIGAIREIIANAVAHRSYVNGEESPITVALYDDRLEVTSPGKLPHGVSVEKMREGCSECRNKALAQALAYMNVIEDWGSGIPRVREDLSTAGLRDLDICEWPNAVRMVIHRRLPPNYGGDNGGKDARSERSAHIIELMRENPKISVSAIVSAIGGGKRSIEREIAALKASGRIARKGTYAGVWRVLDA